MACKLNGKTGLSSSSYGGRSPRNLNISLERRECKTSSRISKGEEPGERWEVRIGEGEFVSKIDCLIKCGDYNKHFLA